MNEIKLVIKRKKNLIIDFGCGFGSLENMIYKKTRKSIAIN